MIYGTHVFDFSLNISFLLRQNSSVFSSLYFFDMQSCLTGIEKVKKIREKSKSCACDVLVRYVLGVSKKKESFRISLLAYKHVLRKSLCS